MRFFGRGRRPKTASVVGVGAPAGAPVQPSVVPQPQPAPAVTATEAAVEPQAAAARPVAATEATVEPQAAVAPAEAATERPPAPTPPEPAVESTDRFDQALKRLRTEIPESGEDGSR